MAKKQAKPRPAQSPTVKKPAKPPSSVTQLAGDEPFPTAFAGRPYAKSHRFNPMSRKN